MTPTWIDKAVYVLTFPLLGYIGYRGIFCPGAGVTCFDLMVAVIYVVGAGSCLTINIRGGQQ